MSSTDTLNRYHPGGDPRNPPKDAPSALHSVIVPNVNLPKVRDTMLLFPRVDGGECGTRCLVGHRAVGSLISRARIEEGILRVKWVAV
jgi:hypothetical protein